MSRAEERPERTVIAAVDGSPVSERAVELASELSRLWQGHLVLLHVREPSVARDSSRPPSRAEPKSGPSPERLVQEWAVRARKSGVPRVDLVLLEGPPVDAILAYAESHPPDLFVFGRRGQSEGSRMLLGGVSSAFLQHARWPVLLVP